MKEAFNGTRDFILPKKVVAHLDSEPPDHLIRLHPLPDRLRQGGSQPFACQEKAKQEHAPASQFIGLCHDRVPRQALVHPEQLGDITDPCHTFPTVLRPVYTQEQEQILWRKIEDGCATQGDGFGAVPQRLRVKGKGKIPLDEGPVQLHYGSIVMHKAELASIFQEDLLLFGGQRVLKPVALCD
jgi:hypothetical protein